MFCLLFSISVALPLHTRPACDAFDVVCRMVYSSVKDESPTFEMMTKGWRKVEASLVANNVNKGVSYGMNNSPLFSTPTWSSNPSTGYDWGVSFKTSNCVSSGSVLMPTTGACYQNQPPYWVEECHYDNVRRLVSSTYFIFMFLAITLTEMIR